MIERHKNAIEINDMMNILRDKQELMTEQERKDYWEAVRKQIDSDIKIKEIFCAVKKRAYHE